MSDDGVCISQPDERILAELGVQRAGDYGEVRWIGTSVPSALFVCALPRSGIFTTFCLIILVFGALFDVASKGLTDRMVRILVLMPFLLLIECVVLYSCTGATKFVYYITDLGVVVKLRPLRSRMWIWGIAFSKFRRDADRFGELFYGYDEIQAVNVRRWFFDLGNVEFSIRRRKKEARPFNRQNEFASTQSISTDNVEKRIEKQNISSKPVRFSSSFTAFPGGNHGATIASAPADFRLGFYGIRNVSSVLRLLESECSPK